MSVPVSTRTALADFVLERIAEDENEAHDLLGIYDTYLAKLHTDRWTRDALAPHLDRWNPRRILADCTAKRRIVGAFQVAQVIQACRSYPGEEEVMDATAATAEVAVLALAAAHADHPDYRTEWRS